MHLNKIILEYCSFLRMNIIKYTYYGHNTYNQCGRDTLVAQKNVEETPTSCGCINFKKHRITDLWLIINHDPITLMPLTRFFYAQLKYTLIIVYILETSLEV